MDEVIGLRTGCLSETGLSRVDFNESLPSRFSEKCGPLNENGCIPWMGYKNSKGYGVLRIGGKKSIRTSAHRIAWVLAYGDLPAGILVLHSCDKPNCVNPNHLFIGSPQDNTADMLTKNRHMWRNRVPWQKLTVEGVNTIFELRRTGCTQQEIADKLGVSRPLISMIESGKIQHATRLAV